MTTPPARPPTTAGPGSGRPPCTVTVVVVMFNSAPLLPDLIESFTDGLAGVDSRVVLVDNDSTDDSIATARRLLPSATILATGHNGGYSAGINAGVAAVGPSDAVLVLNPDVRLGERCVAQLAEAVRRPGVGIAVPRLANRHGNLSYSMRREPTLGRLALETVLGARRLGRLWDVGEQVYDDATYAEDTTTDWAEGSTQLISAQCWRTCGAWDESFFLYSEETEFGLRARAAGFATAYVAGASAVHLEGGSGTTPGLWALLVRNKVVLYARHHGPLASGAYYVLTAAREAARAGLGRETSRVALRGLLSRAYLSGPAGPHSVQVTAPRRRLPRR